MQTKSGIPVFPIGIGTWLIGGSYKPDTNDVYKGSKPNYDNEKAEIEAIRYSIAKGQNHIDCAELYGGFHTDEVVGKAIQGLKRENLYIADKLWKTSVGKGLVRPTVELMLKKLGTDYLDMLYIHEPWDDTSWWEAIPQIDELIDEGKVRAFGVSNFAIKHMEIAKKLARHPIAANQMNYNVLHQTEVTDDFKAYCANNDIQIIAYQPVKRDAVAANATIVDMAEKYAVTPAQIALAWLVTQGILSIPKSIQLPHIDTNVAAATIAISDEDIAVLNAIA